MTQPNLNTDVENAVRSRYSEGAQERVEALCCPTSYDPKYLKVIPSEVLERDYGCGDPSQYLEAGETVLDLGAGTGKICFIAAQVVGETGRVIGVDMNDDMLAVARSAAPVVAERVGFGNVEFLKGKIQDMQLDRDWVDVYLKDNPIHNEADFQRFEALSSQRRLHQPLVADDSVDVVVSNCVLNLVRPEDKRTLFAEIFRVLKRGGRAVISDIVSDEDIPTHLQEDSELWSGCISGAYREDHFLEAFEEAGFHGIAVLERGGEPWQVVENIEFRSLTVVAYKGKQGPCLERKQAVIYRGPFHTIKDDDGHLYRRGVRVAVCDKTYNLLQKAPYRDLFDFVEPAESIPLGEALEFPCVDEMLVRPVSDSKGDGPSRLVSYTGNGNGSCC